MYNLKKEESIVISSLFGERRGLHFETDDTECNNKSNEQKKIVLVRALCYKDEKGNTGSIHKVSCHPSSKTMTAGVKPHPSFRLA